MSTVLCGVDIGGTKLSVGLVQPDGKLVESLTMYDHVGKSPDEIVLQIGNAIHTLLAKASLDESQLAGIGVGSAGHLRYREGVLITMSNLRGFEGYPLRDRLQSRFTAQVWVDNDANAQAYGELKYGAGQGFSNLIFMTLSTQIGAGVILDGRLFRGVTGTAGEIGHTIVEPDSELVCPCGNHGCLIAVASGVALPEVARRKVNAGMRSALFAGPGFDFAQVTGEMVKRGLDEADEVCVSIVGDFARYVGIACYNLFQVFNPEAFVLGGGLMSWGAPFFSGITRELDRLARTMMYDEVTVLPAAIGPHAGIIGAASLALEKR